jgi:hypothetical protein
MSFFSDLFKGNWSELGGDLTHHPWETAAAVGAPTEVAVIVSW